MKSLLSTHNGAKFYKVDLHIHTPVSKCYSRQFKDLKPEEIVYAALKKDLAVIAITDHNSPGWYQQVAAAATGTDLVVLPGVELTCTPGTHLLAIFEPDKSWAVEALLHRAKLPRNQWGDDTAYLTWGVETTLREIYELGGLAIAPHVDSTRGVLEKVYGNKMKVKKILTDHGGQAKAGVLRSEFLAGVSVTKLDTKGFLSSLLKNNHHYKREFPLAFLFDSDAHTPVDIGKRFSWVKMNRPSFAGLKQALVDPDRVLIGTEPLLPSSSIIGFKIEGGFLDGQVFRFNECLNSIIGGRGSGKSVAIKLLRLALDPDFFDNRSQYLQVEDHIPQNIHLWLKLENEIIYIMVDLESWKRTCYHYEEGKLKYLPSLQNRSWAEIYEQGEIHKIAELESQQLALIDRLIKSNSKFREDIKVFSEKEKRIAELKSIRDKFDQEVIRYDSEKSLYEKANYDLIFIRGKVIEEKPYDYLINSLRNFLAMSRILKDTMPHFLPLNQRLEETYLFIKSKDQREKSWLLKELQGKLSELDSLRNSFLSKLEKDKNNLLATFKNGIETLTDIREINKKITLWRQEYCQQICTQEESQFCLEIAPREAYKENPLAKLENLINYNFYQAQEVTPLEQFSRLLIFEDDALKFALKIGQDYRPIDKLSKGQKSVLILMLLAFEERKMPLIIAQPERNLDHDYIFNTLVKMLRKLKTKRQVILTTDNANIVVSADSDLIIALQDDRGRGHISLRGAIDEEVIAKRVQEVLEGGIDAFRFRLKKYGYI